MPRQKPEQKVQNKIINYLSCLQNEGEQVFFEKRQAGGFSYKAGLPDLYVVYRGRHIEVEIKSPDGVRSAVQIKWEQIFKKLGIPYACVASLEEFQKFISKIKESL